MIRAAIPGDAPAMRALLVETWHATYDAIYGAERVTAITGRWHAIEALEAQIRRAAAEPETALQLVVEEQSALLATAAATHDGAGAVSLDRLYVRPAAQGRGHGRSLLAAVLGHWPACRVIRCEVEPANAAAIAFYTAQRFEPVRSGAACGGDRSEGIPHLVMERAVV